MTAAELINALQNVAPGTEVTIATGNGSRAIVAVHSMGYNDGLMQIEI